MSEDDLQHAIKRLQVRASPGPTLCKPDAAHRLLGNLARLRTADMLVWLLWLWRCALLEPATSFLPLLPTVQGLGSGFGVVKIGSRQFVRSMPTELSTDSNMLIELAQVGSVRSVECVLRLRIQRLQGTGCVCCMQHLAVSRFAASGHHWAAV